MCTIFCNKGFACSNKPDLVLRSVEIDTAAEAPEEKFNQVLRPESHLVATPKRQSCCRAGPWPFDNYWLVQPPAQRGIVLKSMSTHRRPSLFASGSTNLPDLKWDEII